MVEWKKTIDAEYGPEWAQREDRRNLGGLELDNMGGACVVHLDMQHVSLDDLRAFLTECDAWIAEQEKTK